MPGTRSTARTTAAWLCTLAACAPGVVLAELQSRIERTGYDVVLDADADLLRALDRASPVRRGGAVFHGVTEWDVRWTIRWWERPDGRCRITHVVSTLTATITLPRRIGGQPAVQQRFDVYLAALRGHEERHLRIGQDAAAAVERRIGALPETASCATLASMADDAGHGALADYGRVERDYDAATGHGRTEGAWLER